VADVTNTLKGPIRANVDRRARIMTDENPSYRGIGNEFDGGHETVKHSAGEYVRGDASTNTGRGLLQHRQARIDRGLSRRQQEASASIFG